MSPIISDADLALFRAEAEARMTSTGEIYRRSEQVQMVDGEEISPWIEIKQDLPGRLAGATSGAGSATTQSEGRVTIARQQPEWHCPYGTKGLRQNDLLKIVTGEHADTFWRLGAITFGDQQTALRIPIEQTDRPSDLEV